jgi:hypothetical protein
VHRNGVPWHPLHRRQRGIPMHSYENRSHIRALILGLPSEVGEVVPTSQSVQTPTSQPVPLTMGASLRAVRVLCATAGSPGEVGEVEPEQLLREAIRHGLRQGRVRLQERLSTKGTHPCHLYRQIPI